MAKFEAWLSCTADDIDTPETTSAEQQNLVARDFKEMEKANRIFNVRNIPYGRTKSKKIEWIFNFIDNNFICKVKAQNGWYALYKFLKDKDLLNINITTDEFSTQMNEWYPDAKAHCKRAETDRYNFLAGYDVESWDKYPKEDYPTNVTARGVKANKQHYMSLTKKYDDQK